ncbi:DUF4192 domain-containing protein [Williamsia sp. CHRR-6]|uniref:DUF4192 domain-containing protein n=1 Tax=Williamsia sp. CHRR-6 TaxID=2835871 RepID=UPI001BDA4458|nr:DUF4192 domain-containing protein [Williamsia sp. CHRR-6]MBT0567922.1 DUF4192 domain-containing protein [Williamsia sp. CHRR-6]
MTIQPPTLIVGDPGDIIAAVPAMLGFVPQRSLVLVAFDETQTRVGVTMRHDVDFDSDGAPSEEMRTVIAQLCDVCLRDNSSGVMALVVDDRLPFDLNSATVIGGWIEVFALVDIGLEHLGLTAGFVIPELLAGAQWHTVWGRIDRFGISGVIDDPTTSAIAVAHTYATGRVVRRTRSELVETLAPVAHCAGLSVVPGRITGGAESRSARGETGDPPQRCPVVVDVADRSDTALLTHVLEAVADGLAPAPLCADVALLDAAIRRLRVRDSLMCLADSGWADDARRLWVELTRRLCGRGRAAAATLLAHLDYTHGDGAMAGVALDTALSADAGYSMAQLLDQSLRSGMRPEFIADLVLISRATAADLGVTMPR